MRASGTATRCLLRSIAIGAIAAAAACKPVESPQATDAPAAGQTTPESRATPRFPDGVVRLDRVPGEKGYWAPTSSPSLIEKGVDVAMDEHGLLANIDDAAKVAPFMPWSLALYTYRQRNGLKDDPVQYCLPPAGPRHLQAPGGFRIVQDRNFKRVYVLFGGGNRNWRVIFLDGRKPPDPDEVFGTYYGHSIGTWEGDTLVVKSTGFNERFWFSNGGLPHTAALSLTERFSRPDFDTLVYEVTIDDPYTYTRPWTSEWTMKWVRDGEIAEHFCEDNRP